MGLIVIAMFGLAVSLPWTGIAKSDQPRPLGKVDVHVHVHPRGPKDARERGTRDDLLEKAAKNLLKQMDRYGVELALVVVVPSPFPPKDEYEILHKVVARFPTRLKLMAGGAQLAPFLQKIKPEDVSEEDRGRFRKCATRLLDEGAAGFGEMISYHLAMGGNHTFQYAPPDHPLFLELADIAAKRDVAIDIHMEAIVARRSMPENLRRTSSKNPRVLEPTIPALEKLLTHNRKARIVWQHIGWDNTGDMTPDLLRRLLNAHSNLYLALRVERRVRQVGQGPAMPNRIVDRRGELQAAWKQLIEDLPGRFVIGSDEFFYPAESVRPNSSFEGTWSLLDQLPPEVSRKLGGDNAHQLYKLRQ